MQAPRLVATDVDGTLLGDDERVSRRTAEVIERVVARGVPFVLVTGRPARWVPPVAAQLPQVRLAVCANGALLYDAVEDRIVWDRALPAARLAELADAVLATLPECGLAVERVGQGGFDEAPPFLADDEYLHAWPEAAGAIVERTELFTDPAVKLLVRAPGRTSSDMVEALAPVVGDSADITFSHPLGLVELSAPGITKASGLATVAASFDVAAADVLAFGDMPNDLEMVRWVGHGVAMANGHPSLRAVADEVTSSNDEDGVALVLERWF